MQATCGGCVISFRAVTPVSFSRDTLVLSAAALLAVTLGPVSNAAPRSSWTQVRSDRLIQGQAPIGAWARGDERCFDDPKYTVSESFANNTASKGEASLITTIAVRAASTQCKQWVSQGLGAVIERQVIVDLDTYRVLESVIDTNQPV